MKQNMRKNIITIILFLSLMGLFIPAIKFTHKAYSKYKSFLNIGANSVVKMEKTFIESKHICIFKAIINVSPEQRWYRRGYIQFLIANNSNNDINDILQKLSKIEFQLKADSNKLVRTKLYLKEQSRKVNIIGFGLAETVPPQNSVFFSTSAGKKSDYITYQLGENNIIIKLYGVTSDIFNKLSAILYTSLNSESAVPYLLIFQAFLFWISIVFILFLLIINYRLHRGVITSESGTVTEQEK